MKIMAAKRLAAVFLATVMSLITIINVSAEEISIEKMLSDIPAEEIIVTECTTGKVLFEKNSQEKHPISHLTKLMTLLITAEKLESGKIYLDDKVTVSAAANSKDDPQIWLDKGEKIRLEELVKAITVGNANDASTAIAEHIAGSEESFSELMNKRAKKLGMNSTHFTDSCGTDEETFSTAYDMSILAAELSEHEEIRPYTTEWLTTVRDGKAELVSQNRLVRTYSGITGMKACSSKTAGECSVVTAEKGDMKIAVVILGCSTSEDRESAAKKLLDMSFESFQLYTPEVTDEMLEDIPVTGGEEAFVNVSFSELEPVIIPRGAGSSIEVKFEKSEQLKAPVKKGQKAGSITCFYGEEKVFSADLKTNNGVKKMNIKCGFLKLLYNLLI